MNETPSTSCTLNSIAELYSALGDYQLSIDTHTQAGDREECRRSQDDGPHPGRIGGVYGWQKVSGLGFSNQALSLLAGRR